jgi:hypothetical protein
VLLNLPTAKGAVPLPYRLFIEHAAEPAKARAIEDLVVEYFGKVRSVLSSITIEEHASGQLQVRVSREIDYKVRTPRDAPEPSDADYMYPWLSELKQGVAVNVRYSPPGARQVQFDGTNSLSGKFRLLVREGETR